MSIRKMNKPPSFHFAEKKARKEGLLPFFESVPMFLKTYRGAFLQLPWCFFATAVVFSDAHRIFML